MFGRIRFKFHGRRSAKWILFFAAAAVPACGTVMPDQSIFAALSALRDSGLAIARLYAAPIPGIEFLAIHPWFVVKTADSTSYTRWEVWQDAGGSFGHVRRNLQSAEADVGAGGAYVIAELQGAAAAAVVDFINTQSPTYPCRDNYVLFPGPNSNSYAQWVLDNTGWNATLPPSAIGKDVPCQ